MEEAPHSNKKNVGLLLRSKANERSD